MSGSIERRLTAIFVADVVGYSRLMGQDENATLSALRQFRGAVLEPLIEKNDGRLIKSMGDGWIAEFSSVAGSVACSIAIQEQLANDSPIKLRIGLHSGDVSFADEDVYGDGINVAARLQNLAEPGAILISETARRSIDARLAEQFVGLGDQQLKNIADPIEVYGWGMAAVAAQRPTLKPPEKPSIAVLAFENLSGSAEQAFFADGIAEDIISALCRFHWFFVTSSGSSFAYRDGSIDEAQVASELGVRYILKGSVRRAGDRVRVAVQLIDAVANRCVWAERFDGMFEDIFELQDEITRNIVSALAPEYLSAEMLRVLRKSVPRLDAWELVARAHWHISQFSKNDVAEARALLLRAIELDPQNSFGLAELSFTYQACAINGWTEDPSSAMSEAAKLAHRAVAINNRDAYAWALLGSTDLFSGRPREAIRQLERAISLNANDPHAFALLGRAMVYLGNSEKGRDFVTQAIRLSPRDPLIALWYSIRSLCEFLDGQHAKAVDWAQASISAQPNRSASYLDLAVNCALCGQLEDASQAVVELKRLNPHASQSFADRLHPFSRTQDRERYQKGLHAAGLPALSAQSTSALGKGLAQR